jgi:GNAT superfamily N-acetyltransferase
VYNLSTPALISLDYKWNDFNSGEPSLDEWLKKRAIRNQTSGASRCFVICDDKKEVIGYYCLSAGAIKRESVPKVMQRSMPDLLPVLVLGRLAIDKKYHNKGLGSALLRDAMIRSVSIAEDAGVFAILIHSLSEQAKRFYLSRGFVESLFEPMTLFMTLATIRSVLYIQK